MAVAMARQGLSLCSASSQQKGWVLKPEHQSQTAEPRTRFGWVLKQEHLEMALSAIVPSAALSLPLSLSLALSFALSLSLALPSSRRGDNALLTVRR